MAAGLATLPQGLQREFGRTPEQLVAAYAGMPVVGYEANAALDDAAKKCNAFLTGQGRWERLPISPAAPCITRDCVSGTIIIAPGPLGGFVATLAYRGYGTTLQLSLTSAGRVVVFGDLRTCATAAIIHAELDATGGVVSDGCLWGLPNMLASVAHIAPSNREASTSRNKRSA